MEKSNSTKKSHSVIQTHMPETQSHKNTIALVPTYSGESKINLIRETAYFIAQKEGFPSGKEMDHWTAAEKMVEQTLSKKKS